ncbi:MAG: pilin [Cardiobacteriaceae bacterium]|nr:pilin [Cardiobacteriaceae bacterium]
MKLRRLALFSLVFSLNLYAETPQQSWLHQTLPAQTEAYLRLPNVWFLENNALPTSPVFQSDAYRTQTQLIRHNLQKQLTSLLPENVRKPLQSFLQHAESALEIAVLNGKSPTILIASHASFSNQKALQQALTQYFPAPWQVSDNTIRSKASAANITYRYDEKNQRLIFSIGDQNAATKLDYIAHQKGEAPFAELETQLDPQHDGFFLWANPQNPLIQMSTQKWQDILRDLGLNNSEQMALNWSVNQQRPHLQLSFKQAANITHNLPQATPINAALSYCGNIDYLALLTLPDNNQLQYLSKSLGNNLDAVTLVRDSFGIDADALAATGTWLFFADDNGNYAVLPKQAKPALENILTSMQSKGILKQRTTIKTNGKDLEHLSFANLFATSAAQAGSNSKDDKLAALLALVGHMQNHYYFMEEGDNLIFSDLPQPLIARQKNNAQETLASWLNSQHLDLKDSAYAYVYNQRNLSRDSYYQGLKRLQTYADLVQAPLDISSLPDADTAQLPVQGAIALRLVSSPSELNLALDLQNGFDDLFNTFNTQATIATTGILAAIALPAYQDYVTRAQIQKQISSSKDLQQVIAEAIQKNTSRNKLTSEHFKKQLNGQDSIRVENGDIHITLQNIQNSYLNDKSIVLHYEPKSQKWQCHTTIPKHYLPSLCR